MAAKKHIISDLVDLDRLQELMSRFSEATAIPVGLVDRHGNHLMQSRWHDFCTMYHHTHPDAQSRCEQNEQNITTHLGSAYSTFRCQNGLREIALPITIESQQVATLFLGQFLYDDDPVDTEHLKEQARRFGYEETEYLAALRNIPVYSHEKVDSIIDYYRGLIALTTDMGMTTVRLRESRRTLSIREREYRQLVEYADAIILRMDPAGRITFINDFGLHFFGYEAAELVGQSVVGTIVPETDSTGRNLQSMIEDVIRHPEEFITNENQNITRSGDRVWVYWNNRPLYDDDNHLNEILSVGVDVTERHFMDAALRKSEARLLAAQRMARMGLYEFELPDGDAFWSPEIYEFLNLDPSRKAFSMMEAFELVHPDDLPYARAAFDAGVQNRSALDVSFRLVPPGHDPIYVRTMGQIQEAAPGGPLVMFGVMMDITESKLAEQRITASLEEKEVLLREVHHRVKNNFQIISSLLTLQVDTITGHAERVPFETAINRIRTMALIHEHLYRSSNLAAIPAEEYLSRICQNIKQVERPSARIHLAIDIGPFSLPIDDAIYFGLIVNELVTNAYRHAFPDGGEGTVILAMHEKSGRFHLSISDTGRGFAPGFNWRQDGSLGLRLVETLSERQLQGTAELADPARAAFHFSFAQQDADHHAANA